MHTRSSSLLAAIPVLGAILVVMLAGVILPMQGCWQQPTLSGTYKVNTFSFVPTSPAGPAATPPVDDGKPKPGIWIDTNTALSVASGTVTSSLPCSVRFDYTDSTFTFESVEFTSVSVTYDNGVVDPAAAGLRLPLRTGAREYESVNSVAGGRIVTTRSLVISGRIADVVTRAEPFRLVLEGHFVTKDGRKLPFTIDQHYDIKSENAVKNAADVLQDK